MSAPHPRVGPPAPTPPAGNPSLNGAVPEASAAGGALAAAVAVFKKWLLLARPDPVYVTLATILANLLLGDPVWVMLVGGPGWGKTVLLLSLAGLAFVRHAGTLTEASLLSGTPQGKRAKSATGGLLREIPDPGLLVLKDFTSVLAMHRDKQAPVLAALREIYDGSWTRLVGTDGGLTLSWKGKLGVLAGCTSAIDSHYGVMAAMGERFLLYRLPDGADAETETKTAERALENQWHEDEMRADLMGAVEALLASVPPTGSPDELPALTADERKRVVALARVTARCRSGVERDPRTRELEFAHTREAPTRIAKALDRLAVAMRLLGVPEDAVWRVLATLALDSMPRVRRDVVLNLYGAVAPATLTTADVVRETKLPRITTLRALEDLTAHGAAICSPGAGRVPATWALSKIVVDCLDEASVRGSGALDAAPAGGTP